MLHKKKNTGCLIENKGVLFYIRVIRGAYSTLDRVIRRNYSTLGRVIREGF